VALEVVSDIILAAVEVEARQLFLNQAMEAAVEARQLFLNQAMEAAVEARQLFLNWAMVAKEAVVAAIDLSLEVRVEAEV
jgi:hypothetical protein